MTEFFHCKHELNKREYLIYYIITLDVITALCSEADLQIPMPVTEYAVEDLPNLVKDPIDNDEPLDEMAQYIKDLGRSGRNDELDPLANAHTLDEMNQYIKDHSDSGKIDCFNMFDQHTHIYKEFFSIPVETEMHKVKCLNASTLV